ncbi:MAG: hypothetical protein U1C53_02635, partial [Candidatus Veblenbacteria bacterium]|nr:hypothetical protein [Candidatus Veblenbacteria bacterium]
SASLVGNPSTSGWTNVTTFTYTPTCVAQGGSTTNPATFCVTQVSTNSGGSWNNISTTQTANQTRALVSGSNYRFRTVETDSLGSITSTSVPASGNIQVDTQAPTQVTLTLTGSPTSTSFSLSWTASSDPLSGLARYELWRAPNQGGAPGVWAKVKDVAIGTLSTTDTPPSSGIWWYGLHTVDNVGNWSTEVTARSGTYDNVPPVASNHIPAKGGTVVELRPTLQVTLSDNLSSIGASTLTVTLGGNTVKTKSFPSGTTTLSIGTGEWSGVLANGPYTVRVQSVDSVGNALDDSSWTFTENNAAPAKPVVQ